MIANYYWCRIEDITDPETIRQKPKCDRKLSMYGYVRGTHLKNHSMIHLPGNLCPPMYKHHCMNVPSDKCHSYCLIQWYFIEIEDRMKQCFFLWGNLMYIKLLFDIIRAVCDVFRLWGLQYKWHAEFTGPLSNGRQGEEKDAPYQREADLCPYVRSGRGHIWQGCCVHWSRGQSLLKAECGGTDQSLKTQIKCVPMLSILNGTIYKTCSLKPFCLTFMYM